MARKRKPYRYKLRYKLVFWSLIAMVVFSVLSVFMNRPSEGVIVKPSLEDNPGQTQQAKTNTITAKNFSLTYDSSLDTVSNISQNDSTALEVYRVSRSDVTGRRILVITIKNLPAGGASEESSYKLRRITPGTYTEGAETLGENAFVTFTKNDQTEFTGFAVKDNKLAMISYTLQAPDGDLHKEAAELFSAFKWQ